MLVCNVCKGELELLSNDSNFTKLVKCLDCCFTNSKIECKTSAHPEVYIKRKKVV